MRPGRSGQQGETLLELLITISIMAGVVVAIIAGIATAADTSDMNKKEVGVEVVLRNYAEAVKGAPYNQCAAPDPATIAYPNPTGFTVSAPVLTGCYDAASGTWCATSPCNGRTDAVRLRLQVTTTDAAGPHQRSKSLEIVKTRDYARPA